MTSRLILVAGHYPFVSTRELPTNERPVSANSRRLSVYWLMDGPKGSHWCYATGRNHAQTVYRNIPWDGPKRIPMSVNAIARTVLADGAVFWIKQPKEPSAPWCMRHGRLTPAPDGYLQVEPPRNNDEGPSA